jgi:hypothetical protein
LIDHYYFADAVRSGYRPAHARFRITRLAFRAQKIPVEHIVNQSGFAGTRNACNAGENADRNIDIDVFQIVLTRAADFE